MHPMYLDFAEFIKFNMPLAQKEDDFIEVIDQIHGTETRRAYGQLRKETVQMALDYLGAIKASVEFYNIVH